MTDETRKLRRIPVAAIRPNPRQPRKTYDEDKLAELAASINAAGQRQPVEVEELPGGEYMLHYGHRRLAAVMLLGWKTIEALVAAAQDDATLLANALIENVMHEDMLPVEEAAAYQDLVDTGLSVNEVSRRTGKSIAHINNRMKLLDLDRPIQEAVNAGDLPRDRRVAEALMTLPDEARVALAMRVRGQSIQGIIKAVSTFHKMSQAQQEARRPDAGRNGCTDTRRGRRPGNRKRAHALLLVLCDEPVPGPTGPALDAAATAACTGCALFEFDPDAACKDCPLTAAVRVYVNEVAS